MARTSYPFLSKISPPALFVLNLHQLVTAGTSYYAKCLSLFLFHSCQWWYTAKIHVEGTMRIIVKFILSFLYGQTPVKIHDFSVSSEPWDFSVQLDPAGLSAVQFCCRICQKHLPEKNRERRQEDLIHSSAQMCQTHEGHQIA